jgi:predicted acyl esterase
MPYNLPLPCDILFEQDFCVPMRDGIKLYCDVFRPPNVEKVPIILAWAPYGKHGNSELFLNELPERLGIPKSTYSGYENFEGPDPAYWYVLATNLV